MGQVILTFDVEQDCPPFASSTRGMEEGLPLVMDLLEDSGIKGTFLFTGRMAEKFPELARRAAKKHELGCHGLEHERFDRLPGKRLDAGFLKRERSSPGLEKSFPSERPTSSFQMTTIQYLKSSDF